MKIFFRIKYETAPPSNEHGGFCSVILYSVVIQGYSIDGIIRRTFGERDIKILEEYDDCGIQFVIKDNMLVAMIIDSSILERNESLIADCITEYLGLEETELKIGIAKKI